MRCMVGRTLGGKVTAAHLFSARESLLLFPGAFLGGGERVGGKKVIGPSPAALFGFREICE